ncbi:hypothetical protein V2J09_013798 [Rumex salicifolius]
MSWLTYAVISSILSVGQTTEASIKLPDCFPSMTSTISFTCPINKKQLTMECFRKSQSSVILPVDSVTFSYGNRLHYQLCLFGGSHPFFVNKSKSTWSLRSSVNENPTNNSSGTTRLIKFVQNLQTKLNAGIQKLRKNLPMKILFFLVGFYSATAFSTVIGQTGDWDILSAALAVVVVEGIGALMYRTSAMSSNRIRVLIVMFNYWKGGLSLGLFLDSFKIAKEMLLCPLPILLIICAIIIELQSKGSYFVHHMELSSMERSPMDVAPHD